MRAPLQSQCCSKHGKRLSCCIAIDRWRSLALAQRSRPVDRARSLAQCSLFVVTESISRSGSHVDPCAHQQIQVSVIINIGQCVGAVCSAARAYIGVCERTRAPCHITERGRRCRANAEVSRCGSRLSCCITIASRVPPPATLCRTQIRSRSQALSHSCNAHFS